MHDMTPLLQREKKAQDTFINVIKERSWKDDTNFLSL